MSTIRDSKGSKEAIGRIVSREMKEEHLYDEQEETK
jgi:hypothetical protein